MHSELKLLYYRTVLIQTKRGNWRGKVINAKPIFLIALFNYIEDGAIIDNKILFDNKLNKFYEKHYSIYESETQITPLHKPFYHLQSDGYWHLSWNNDSRNIQSSAKFLRENLKHASFDNALWDLLQDAKTRSILRDTVINHFLFPRNN